MFWAKKRILRSWKVEGNLQGPEFLELKARKESKKKLTLQSEITLESMTFSKFENTVSRHFGR